MHLENQFFQSISFGTQNEVTVYNIIASFVDV